MNLHLAILRVAAWLVPRPERPEWLAEWLSELWYASRSGIRRADVLRFCLGAFRDSLWLRRNQTPEDVRHPLLQSPLSCLAFLTTVATLAIGVFIASPKIRSNPFVHAGRDSIISVQLLMIAFALVILATITPLSLGDYASISLSRRIARWTFLALKFILVLPIVAFGTADLGPLLTADALQPQAMLVGYVLAFRWVLTDQRRRCPVCLRLLTDPTRIGQASQTFLELYGTELLCLRGHGLLYVPAIPATHSTQRWLALDSSWSSLFSSTRV
jgi:hypothetical protein